MDGECNFRLWKDANHGNSRRQDGIIKMNQVKFVSIEDQIEKKLKKKDGDISLSLWVSNERHISQPAHISVKILGKTLHSTNQGGIGSGNEKQF